MTALPHTDACEICQSIRRYTGRAYSRRRRRRPPPPPTPAPPPDITVERHPGGGWYWRCYVGDIACDDGAPTNWRGWARPEAARVAAGLHLTKAHAAVAAEAVQT